MARILWLIIFTLLIVRVGLYFYSQPYYPDGTKLKISGKITTQPTRYDDSQYIKLEGFKIYLPSYPQIYYGDDVVVSGVVEEDKLQEAVLEEHLPTDQFLYVLRKNLLNFYAENLPQDSAALVSGMTIGAKELLTSEFWDELKKTGTAHVVVASGMNVALISKFLMLILIFFLPRKRAIPAAIAGIWFYAALAGFDSPIIRAAIMGSVAFTAQELGKIYSGVKALILSAVVMLFVKPEWVMDLGFWLSFAATGSLMLFERRIAKYLKRVPLIFREDLTTSTAAQIGVAPIMLLFFGKVTILAPVINMLVLWTVLPITIIGLAAGFLGLIYVPIGRAVLLLTYPLTLWFIRIVELFA